MRILIWTQYFHPENFPINDVAESLVESGDFVTVLTGKPNYPVGKIFPGYRRWGIQCDEYRGIRIIRVPVLERGRGKLMRLANYFSFFVSASLLSWGVLRGQRFDCILAYGPSPLPNCFPAAILGRVLGVKSSLWVQDLWPESLRTSGVPIPRFFFWILKIQSHILYRGFDQILVQSKGFIPSVLSYWGMTRERVRYLPNSYRRRTEPCEGKLEKIRSEIADCFSVVFAGNIGKAQNLSLFVEAARRLQDRDQIRFFLLGDGSERESLLKEVSRLGLKNLSAPGAVPRASVDSFLEAASLLALSLRDVDGVAQTIPSKLQGYMAAGRPILFACTGEGEKIIKEAECGICVDPNRPEEFAAAVESVFLCDQSRRDEMGEKGRLYFEKNFSPRIQIAQLREALAFTHREPKGS